MATFELDTGPAVKKLTDLQKGIAAAGKTLDTLEKNMEKAVRAVARSSDARGAQFDVLSQKIGDTGKNIATIQSTLKSLEVAAQTAFINMATANQNAQIKLEAYSSATSDLGKLLRNTDATNSAISHQQKLNGMRQKAVEQTQYYVKALAELERKEFKSARAAKQSYDSEVYRQTALQRTSAALAKAKVDMEQATSAEGKKLAATRASIAAQNQLNAAEAAQTASKAVLTRQIQLLSSAEGQQVLALKRELAALKSGVRVQDEDVKVKNQRAEATARLNRELAYLRSSEGRAHVLLQQQVAAERKAIVASTEAQVRKNAQLRLGAQLTAGMRASLAGLQTSIGMYTSSTILAATAFYGLARAIRSTITSGAEFQATMKRTSAIMGGAMDEASRAGMFANMEDTIRSLGKTTQFTATEVAAAMTELGQAGLTAGQGMIALQPTLDLAIIGGLDMAKAADHATNIMMIFNKEAKDLTGIVDLMATAVTRSNTNVDQLANSLTYAGPAAETMGLGIKDVVAAVASLANSGFKASRSGTALRRLFVSLANPTKKGQEVLDRFNISVVDLEGKTRSLTSILGQLSRGMKGLEGTEQLAAIQNLVGVYASSPISALVSQVENFEALRRSMEYAGGAAARMKEEIETALKFDAKQAFSAFQEAQLQVFDKVSARLQILSLETAQWLTSLSQPFGDDENVSKLDVYLVRFERLSLAITALGAAWIASRLTGSSGGITNLTAGLQASSVAAKAASVSYSAVAAGGRQYTMVLNAQATSLNNSTLSQRLHNQALLAANTAYTAGATALSVYNRGLAAVATGVGYVTKGLGLLVRGFGWIGLAWSAYEIFNSFFGKSSQDMVKEKTENIAALGERYLTLRDNMKLANAEEKLKTDKKTKAEIESSINRVNKEIIIQQENVVIAEANGIDPTRFKDEIVGLKFQLTDLNNSLVETDRQIAGAYKTANDSLDRMRDRMEVVGRLVKQEADQRARGNINSANAIAKNIARQQEAINLALNSTTADVARADALEALNAAQEKGLALTSKSAVALSSTKFDTYLDSLRAVAAAEKDYADKKEQISKSPMVMAIDYEDAEKALQTLISLRNSAAEAGKEFRNMSADTEEIKRKILDLQLTEEERDAQRALNLEKIIQLRIAEEIAIGSGQLSEDELAAKLARRLELYKKELELRTEIKAKEDKPNRQGSGGAKGKDPAVEKLKNAQTAYEALRAKYDQVGVSAEKLAKITEQLTYLKANDAKFTEEHYLKALRQAKIDHYAVVVAQDKQLQTLNKLRESYMASGIQKQVDDLAALEKSYEGVANKGAEYARIKERILKSAQPAEGPRAQMPEATGPFSAFLNASVTQSTDLQTYDKSAVSLIDNQQLGSFAQQDKFAAAAEAQMKAYADQQMSEAEHLAAMKKLGDEYTQGQLANNALYNDGVAKLADERTQYQEQSNMLVLASMAGSLSSMLGMVAKAGEDATSAQKVAFVAQKALAVAQILIQTHVGAAMATGMGPAGIPLSTYIMAQGYASAGLVAAMAIGELAGGSSSGGGDSSYAGAYDKGGYIPTGKHGIVGEYGPEIVNGPAHVTGREATARKLSGAGGNVTIAPVIQIDYKSEGGGSGEDSKKDAALLANTVKIVVLDTIKNELRPNGMLYRS